METTEVKLARFEERQKSIDENVNEIKEIIKSNAHDFTDNINKLVDVAQKQTVQINTLKNNQYASEKKIEEIQAKVDQNVNKLNQFDKMWHWVAGASVAGGGVSAAALKALGFIH